MEKILSEELNRIKEIMGVKPIILEATFPGLNGIVQTVKRVTSAATQTGRVFAGDATEISSAIRLLNSATNIVDEFEALAKLCKVSPELEQTISPMLINTIRQMSGGQSALDDIDNLITQFSLQGVDVIRTESAVNTLIDNTFSTFPKGAKDILKQEMTKKIRNRGSLSPLPFQYAQNITTAYEDFLTAIKSNPNNKRIMQIAGDEIQLAYDDLMRRFQNVDNHAAFRKAADDVMVEFGRKYPKSRGTWEKTKETFFKTYLPKDAKGGLKIGSMAWRTLLSALIVGYLFTAAQNAKKKDIPYFVALLDVAGTYGASGISALAKSIWEQIPTSGGPIEPDEVEDTKRQF